MTPLNHQEFRRQGHMIIDMLADYYRDIEKYPVRSQVEPGYLRQLIPEDAPDYPEPIETILQDVQRDIVPGLTHWQSPNYFAYFPSSGSIAGMLRLPESFLFSGNGGGVIHGTTCEAILCTLVAARDQMLDRVGRDNILRLVVYASDQTHCALQKAAQVAGIHPDNVRVLQTTKLAAFALSPHSLRSAIISDKEAGMIPLFLCATVGTTSSTAVDPVEALCDFRHFINALSTNPEYLRNGATNSKRVVDYKDWQIALSRRFRAMKLWLVLRSYGVSNLRSFIRRHIEMAKHFEQLIATDKRFEVVVPRNFSTVCFRVSPSAIPKRFYQNSNDNEIVNALNSKLLESLNGSGRVFMTHAIVGGVYIIRFAVGASLTEERHVNMAWEVIQQYADAILSTS
ncbi:unnamed protein product, partial [Vitis vinifera]